MIVLVILTPIISAFVVGGLCKLFMSGFGKSHYDKLYDDYMRKQKEQYFGCSMEQYMRSEP